MFGITRNDHMERQLRALRDENAVLKAANESLGRELAGLKQDLGKEPTTRPANLEQVTHFLKAFVPTLPAAPGYKNLTAATDPKSYAQALNLLLLHARAVGRQEMNR